jgi:chaperonin GroES
MLKPTGDHVCIKPEEATNRTKSGLLLGASDVQIPYEGIVVSKGRNCIELEVGDRVIYNKYSGCDINIKGEVFRVAREKEIFGSI